MAAVYQHIRREKAGVQRWLFVVATLLLSLFLTVPTWAQEQPIPMLDDWVVDTTNTFNLAQKQELSARLAAFEKNKGAQIFVFMVPTTEPEEIAQYTRRVYDQWKVGRKNVDDGVLLVVAKDDRRLRIEVGYGLEGAVTDLQAGRIIREFITPYFMYDDYVAGINAGVDKIMDLVEGEELPPPAQNLAVNTDEDGPLAMLLPMAFFAFVLPPLAAALIIGFFSFFIFWSIPIAVGVGFIALILSLVGKAFGAGAKGSSGRASRRGAALGGLGGGFGGGFGRGGGIGGGGGGGGVSGGGGSSGGGGASGGW